MFFLTLLLACTAPAPLEQPSAPPVWPLTNAVVVPKAAANDPKDALNDTSKEEAKEPTPSSETPPAE